MRNSALQKSLSIKLTPPQGIKCPWAFTKALLLHLCPARGRGRAGDQGRALPHPHRALVPPHRARGQAQWPPQAKDRNMARVKFSRGRVTIFSWMVQHKLYLEARMWLRVPAYHWAPFSCMFGRPICLLHFVLMSSGERNFSKISPFSPFSLTFLTLPCFNRFTMLAMNAYTLEAREPLHFYKKIQTETLWLFSCIFSMKECGQDERSNCYCKVILHFESRKYRKLSSLFVHPATAAAGDKASPAST